MNEHATKKITRARTRLLLDHFFWGRLALYLTMNQSTAVPTLAVDGKQIIYNPDFILGLSDELVKSAIAHEIGHCMFEHISRRKARDPKLWNKAGDFAINIVLKDSGFQIGSDWLYDIKYAGMSAEHIYELLKEEDSSGGSGSSGDALCDIRECSDSSAEVADQQMEWKVAVAHAAAEAKKRGALPGSMNRFVDEIISPKVPWREVLRRFINQLARDDYTWARPNRKFVALNAYIPSLYSERMGSIVVVIDTSGSIDQPTLNAFASEIRAIAAQARPQEVKVIYCDAEVKHIDVFGIGEEMQFKMHGGGGTDFRPPFKHIEESGEPPAALVYLTDGYGPFPEGADFPVLWCCTTNVEGPFGETVQLEL